MNSSGDIVFDTSEDATYRLDYTYETYYVFGDISLDTEFNSVTMLVTGNNNDWKSQSKSYLSKIIGVKL